jgi:6-phosphogluconolactonase (cycloisomerase 2 family)
MPTFHLLSTTVLAASLALSAHFASAQSADSLSGISAGKVAVISDGDYVAKTYADGVLAPVEAGHEDVLTVLSITDGKVREATIPVSNSVTAAPEILELTPDGRTAFVTERLGERPEGATTMKELPPGNRLFAIDLSDSANPKLADTAEIGLHPEGLAVSPDGRRVAVVSNTAEESLLQIVEFRDGRFGPVARFDLAELGVTGEAAGPRGGVTATNVQWHPSGGYLAANINTQDRVAFFEVSDGDNGPALKLWGNIVETGRDPFVGRFTPDGRHYLTSNWGRNFAATSLDGRIPDAASTMSVIRLADPEAQEGEHERLATIDTDISAEGMAVSPDGRLVATFNMRGTTFAPGTPRYSREAGISLLSFDPQTGTLTKLSDTPFEAVLPEGGTFDLTGDHVIATSFEAQPDAAPGVGAGLAVFRVVKDGTPRLEPVGRVPLPHGVHHVDVAP